MGLLMKVCFDVYYCVHSVVLAVSAFFVLGEAGYPARMADMAEHLAGDQLPWRLLQQVLFKDILCQRRI